MSAQSLLLKLPVPLQNFAISLYGVRVRFGRYGGFFSRYFRELLGHDSWSKQQLAEFEQSELTRLLQWASEHSPYYSEILQGVDAGRITKETLSQHIGILEKDFLRHHADRFRVASETKDGKKIFTSGTSGSPLVVSVNDESIKKNYAFYARTLSWFGLHPLDRHATFAGRVFLSDNPTDSIYWRTNAFMHQKLFSSYHISENTIPAYLDELEKWSPHYIDSYPSAISQLAQFVNRSSRQWRIRPKAILVSSETLSESQREEIEKAFQCKVIDQYGNAEMAAWANQCEHGSLHLNSDYGLVELVDEDGRAVSPGQVGEVICTGFINYAMPMIRYRIGDSAIMSSSPCSCGRPYPVIEQIVGRTDGLIVTPTGRTVGRMDPVFKGVENVIAAQIVQHKIDALLVKLIPAPGFSDVDKDKLVTQIQGRTGHELSVEIDLVQDIPKSRNGKFQSVVSLEQFNKRVS